MNISLNQTSPTDGLITIKIEEQDYQAPVANKTKDYARKANIKGFRQGMVPMGIIKKMFGKSILLEEVNRVISESINNFIKEKKLKVLGDPMPDNEKTPSIDWEVDKTFEFVFKVGTAADFKVELSNKIKLQKYTIEVDKTVLEETLDETRKRYGTPEYPEVSEGTDVLYGEKTDGTEEKKVNTYVVIAKAKTKEQKRFVGLKIGDVVVFNAKDVFESEADQANALGIHEGDLASTDGSISMKVNIVSRTIPSELNQEFFDKVFGKDVVKSEEEFAAKVKETIASNYERETNHLLEHEIEHHLMDNTKIDLPDQFLKEWLKATGNGNITDEVLEKEFNDYKNSIKFDLIRNQIAEDHQIKVEAAEVRDRAKQLIINQFGGPAALEMLKDRMDQFADNYLQGNEGKNFMNLYNGLRTERIMAKVKELATITEKKVTLEEFKKAASAHNH